MLVSSHPSMAFFPERRSPRFLRLGGLKRYACGVRTVRLGVNRCVALLREKNCSFLDWYLTPVPVTKIPIYGWTPQVAQTFGVGSAFYGDARWALVRNTGMIDVCMIDFFNKEWPLWG